jgi:hypothetical protein
MTPYVVIRIARIIAADRTTGRCTIAYTDVSSSESPVQAMLPHPLGMGETGIFLEPIVGARVLVDLSYMNEPYIVSYLPNSIFEQQLSLNNSQFMSANFLSRPAAAPGEITLKGFGNTYTQYLENGNIETHFGLSKVVYDAHDIHSVYAESTYQSLSSGYSVSGEIKRELDGASDTAVYLERLTDPIFDDELSFIGRNPSLPISLKTSPDPKVSSVRRNPPFVEERRVVYEFARNFSAGSPKYEGQLYSNASDDLYSLKEQRQGSRTDAFGLGPLQYNLLMESIVGTAVDLYGNLLDLNRTPISMEGVSAQENNVEDLYGLLRRSVKFHFELNSRKADGDIDFESRSGSFDSAQNTSGGHSRWFVDVDAEGQTKINIPASSSSGNIPVAARYVSTAYYDVENADDLSLYETRTDGGVDLSLINYNTTGAGVAIAGAPDSRTEPFSWNMPYHNFTFADILDRRTYFYPGAILGAPSALSRTASYGVRLSGIDPQSQSATSVLTASVLSNTFSPNAGGRSLHMNLDGSAELSLGYDEADHKSLCLDTAGSALLRMGKDLRGRSLVMGADGDVVLVVGASRREQDPDGVIGAGLQIFVEGPSGVASIQIIDGNIIIKGAPDKNLVIESAGNLVLNAGKDLLLGGERVFLFGKYTEDGVTQAGEREVLRTGNKVI